MSITATPNLRDLQALRASVEERVRWLKDEITAHGNSGNNDRRRRAEQELTSLKRKSASLKASIQQLETAALISPPRGLPSRSYSARVGR